MYEALSWIELLGLNQVVFQFVCKFVCNALSFKEFDQFEFDTIIKSCKNIMVLSSSFNVKHVHREANFVAHQLTRSFRDFLVAHVWVEPPTLVDGLPIFSCSC